MILLPLTACMSLDGLVIPGDPRETYDWSDLNLDPARIEEVSFTAADGAELHGAWFRQLEPAPPLLWFHGNGGAMDRYVDRIQTLVDWGLHDVFAFDYRGFGRSPGPATRDGVLEEDGLAAVRYVADATGLDPTDLPWVTLSLGGAVAIHTVDEIGARAVVLESVLSGVDPLVDEAAGLDLPTGWFFRDDWDNVAEIRHATAPLFLIHGQQDDFIDPSAAVRLYNAAPDPKHIWRPVDVGHADILEVRPDEYRARVLAFLADPERGP